MSVHQLTIDASSAERMRTARCVLLPCEIIKRSGSRSTTPDVPRWEIDTGHGYWYYDETEAGFRKALQSLCRVKHGDTLVCDCGQCETCGGVLEIHRTVESCVAVRIDDIKPPAFGYPFSSDLDVMKTDHPNIPWGEPDSFAWAVILEAL